MQSLFRRLSPILLHPRLPIIAAFLGILFCLPALWNGFQSDDLVHRVSLKRIHLDVAMLVNEPMKIFTFVPEDPVRTKAVMDFGVFPWWTHPQLRLALFRPLSAFSHVVDYALWADTPMLMHIHSLAWYGLLVWIAATLYRRLMGAGIAAGLASLFYALDDAHGFGAGWLANRNAVICAALGLGALLLHDLWRTGRKPAWGVAAAAAFAAALCAGEGALAASPYLLAYALFLDGPRRNSAAPLSRRLMTLAPYMLIGIVYVMHHKIGKYGARLSGVYIDPATEPLRYLVFLARNAPVLLLGQLAMPPSDIAALLAPGMRIAFSAGAACAVAAIFWVARPWLRVSPAVRALLFGMAVSVLPISATFASNRLLFFVGFGAMGLVGLFLENAAAGAPGRAARRLTWAMFAVHGVLGPLMLPMFVSALKMPQKLMDRVTQSFPFDEPGLASRRVVLLRSPSPLATSFIPIEAALNSRPLPLSMRTLSASSSDLQVERTDDRTLLIRPVNGFNPGIEHASGPGFLPLIDFRRILVMLDSLFRDPAIPFELGEKIGMTGMTIEVTEVAADGRAMEARFTFDVSLDDPSLIWLDWDFGALTRSAPPAVGAKIMIPEAGLEF